MKALKNWSAVGGRVVVMYGPETLSPIIIFLKLLLLEFFHVAIASDVSGKRHKSEGGGESGVYWLS